MARSNRANGFRTRSSPISESDGAVSPCMFPCYANRQSCGKLACALVLYHPFQHLLQLLGQIGNGLPCALPVGRIDREALIYEEWFANRDLYPPAAQGWGGK